MYKFLALRVYEEKLDIKDVPEKYKNKVLEEVEKLKNR